jgi:hypothetical protein
MAESLSRRGGKEVAREEGERYTPRFARKECVSPSYRSIDLGELLYDEKALPR